ncbi:hypothetical protein J3459_008356 [Metarhizium acridum]|nr:hypothetical protein J3459_008356 [Metarhizium acridum]
MANTFGWQCFIRARPPVRMTSASPWYNTPLWTPDSGCCRPSWLCRTSGETQNDRRDVAVVHPPPSRSPRPPPLRRQPRGPLDRRRVHQPAGHGRARAPSLAHGRDIRSRSESSAWAGPSAPDSNVAVNLLRRIADSVDVDFASLALRPRESGAPARTLGSCSTSTKPCPGTGRSRRPGRPSSTGPGPRGSGCGRRLRSAPRGGGRRAADPGHPRFRRWTARTARTALVARTAVHGGARRVGPRHLLRQMRRTECAGPPVTYGFLGILPAASQGLARRIRPDYRKPAAEAYKELVLAEMEATRRADAYTAGGPDIRHAGLQCYGLGRHRAAAPKQQHVCRCWALQRAWPQLGRGPAWPAAGGRAPHMEPVRAGVQE